MILSANPYVWFSMGYVGVKTANHPGPMATRVSPAFQSKYSILTTQYQSL